MEQNGKGLSKVNEYYSQYGLRAKELHASRQEDYRLSDRPGPC